MNLAIVHDSSCVFSSLHVELSPPHQRFRVLGIQLQRLVEVIKSLKVFFSLDESLSPVGVDDRIEFFVGRIEINSLSVLLLGLLVFLLFDELVSFFFQLLALLGSHQGISTLLVVGVQPHPLCEKLLSPSTFSSIEFNDPL